MARTHPVLEPLRQLRVSLSQLRLRELPTGRDGRNRCLLSAFRATTGRNQPSNSKYIFGPAACGAMTLLNLHPAAPGGPIGIWQDVIWQLIASRAERSGVTIFRAIPEVDTGPPLQNPTVSNFLFNSP